MITSKDKNRVVIESTGHPAAHRKMRCPKCKLGYAVETNAKKGDFICQRCGTAFQTGQI